MDERTDTELVALARAGDKGAFGELADRYWCMTTHIACRMVDDGWLAEELAQEAILQAYLSLNHLRDAAHFRSWLYGIVLNLCRSYIRSQKRKPLSLEELEGGMLPPGNWLIEDMPRPDEIAEARELHRLVIGAVHALPPGDRDAVLLFYYGQRSLQEVSALLGISVTAVKGRLRRARGRLREQLRPILEFSQVAIQRRDMTKVTVEDVRQVSSKDGKRMVIVILADEARQTLLPIWVGEHEGTQLAVLIRQTALPRPLTTVLMGNLLHASGAEVQEVQITTLKDDIFYATVRLSTASGAQEVDARPSDAITLAAHLGKPIYASEDVLKAAGLPATEFAQHAEAQATAHGTQFSWEESVSLLKEPPEGASFSTKGTSTGESTQAGK